MDNRLHNTIRKDSEREIGSAFFAAHKLQLRWGLHFAIFLQFSWSCIPVNFCVFEWLFSMFCKFCFFALLTSVLVALESSVSRGYVYSTFRLMQWKYKIPARLTRTIFVIFFSRGAIFVKIIKFEIKYIPVYFYYWTLISRCFTYNFMLIWNFWFYFFSQICMHISYGVCFQTTQTHNFKP